MTTFRSKAVLCIGSDFVNLNLRCSFLERHGWHVMSSGKGHDGVFRFSREHVDAVVIDLDGDGSEAALIAAELKRRRANVPVIMLVRDEGVLVPGATAQADAILLKSDEAKLLHKTLKNILHAV